MKKRVRPVYERGTSTVEFPFLLSCAVFLLDRRFWILGIRYPLCGIRFDLLAKIPSIVENVMLVEAKYRNDGRPVRPHEVKRFVGEVTKIKEALPNCIVQGAFTTNTKFSEKSIVLATKHGIRIFPRVPLLFELKDKEEKKTKSRKKNANDAQDLSSNVSNRAGR